jgi:hypothetical protein
MEEELMDPKTESLMTILLLQNENKKLKQKIAELKYTLSQKGQDKIKRNNEVRRISTAYKKVIEEFKKCHHIK